jgi:epoxyqueuosine reductase
LTNVDGSINPNIYQSDRTGVSSDLSAKDAVVRFANTLGFDYVGITSPESLQRGIVAQERVRGGFMRGLNWYTEERVSKASNPKRLLPEAQSIISLAVSYYYPVSRSQPLELHGKIARYAWSEDYHSVLKNKARLLVHFMEKRFHSLHNRIFVDDGPLLERAVAERSGIAWYGKNTMMLTRNHGSWVLLAEILTDLSLPEDQKVQKNCGSCTICIAECPTGALTPYALDNQKCISFWTIEHKGIIPKDMRPLIGTWVFGCDLCQDVCPVNRKIEKTRDSAFVRSDTHIRSIDLIDMLKMTPEQYQMKFKGSPIKRAKLNGLKRNACIALGNIGNSKAVSHLERVLIHSDSIVQIHAAWALGQIGGKPAEEVLTKASLYSKDKLVVNEIIDALDTIRCAHSDQTGV